MASTDREQYWRYKALSTARSLFSSTFVHKPGTFGEQSHHEAQELAEEALAEIWADPFDRTIGGNCNPWKVQELDGTTVSCRADRWLLDWAEVT